MNASIKQQKLLKSMRSNNRITQKQYETALFNEDFARMIITRIINANKKK